jgi:hypothetical protein
MTKSIHYMFPSSPLLFFFYKIYFRFYELKKFFWENNSTMNLEMYLRLTKAMDLEEHDILIGGKFY